MLRSHRRVRSLALILLIAAPLLTGGWLELRNSPLVSVRHVHIAGVQGVDARAIERALRGAAKGMSTMDVNRGALSAAVATYPQVREVHASTSFPHSMRITVTEQLPVATLLVGSERTAVAADGVVLGPAFASANLPVIRSSEFPSRRVSEAQINSYLAILGAAPAPLGKLLSRVFTSAKGITVQTRSGMLIYFGDATRAHAKWLSFARVLIAQGSTGASYIDVRLPERPAAGMPGEGTPTTADQTNALDPTSAALAASLASAVNGNEPQTSATSQSTETAPATAPSEVASPTGTPQTTESTTGP
jgi:cell division protein FtsQ